MYRSQLKEVWCLRSYFICHILHRNLYEPHPLYTQSPDVVHSPRLPPPPPGPSLLPQIQKDNTAEEPTENAKGIVVLWHFVLCGCALPWKCMHPKFLSGAVWRTAKYQSWIIWFTTTAIVTPQQFSQDLIQATIPPRVLSRPNPSTYLPKCSPKT